MPVQLIFIVYVIVMLLIERPFPIIRIWLWMIPLLAIWCSAGIIGALQWITLKWSNKRFRPALVAVLLVGFAANGITQSHVLSNSARFVEDPVAEKVTLFLKPQITRDSLVVVSGCSNARYWYYFRKYGIPADLIGKRDRFFNRVFIIAYTQSNPSCGNEKMLDVFQQIGPDTVFFDMNTIRIISEMDYATIYEVIPIPERIEKAYPDH